MASKYYLCIDLKTFYASVECVERHLDPFETNLVVADPSRGNGAICLAISPKMKAQGVKNRCRIFEIPKNIKYITAIPRMKLYIKYSADIYSIYLKYVSAEDILVYSIDECFLDITPYLALYKMNYKELAKKIMDDIMDTYGICATAGIGTNLFLAKVALDITAKHVDDHIGFLDEEEFKKSVWHHKPITDIWNIGRGIAKRLEKYKAYDLYDVNQLDEKILYKEFGVNAEFLIDHARGYEPVTIKEIHNYRSKDKSLSNGQILFNDYCYSDALLVVKEMVDLGILDLIEKKLVTNGITLIIGYSKNVISHTGGNMKLEVNTNSRKVLLDSFVELYEKTTDRNHPIRTINIGFNNVVDEAYQTLDLFTDESLLIKERKMQDAIISIRNKFGKNAILKGMNLEEKATTIKRNKLIGGHNAEW